MVAQESLELFVMVRIHAGQPVFQRKTIFLQPPARIPHTICPTLNLFLEKVVQSDTFLDCVSGGRCTR